jgi:hypothetical protein
VNFNELESLAADLKSLIGYGAKPNHVLSRKALRDLVMSKHPGLEGGALKQAIIEELKLACDLLPEPEAESCRELLTLSRSYQYRNAVRRREDVIVRLGLYCSVETFRRPEGPEMELMRLLAKAFYAV